MKEQLRPSEYRRVVLANLRSIGGVAVLPTDLETLKISELVSIFHYYPCFGRGRGNLFPHY
jgi:hypothetical protein